MNPGVCSCTSGRRLLTAIVLPCAPSFATRKADARSGREYRSGSDDVSDEVQDRLYNGGFLEAPDIRYRLPPHRTTATTIPPMITDATTNIAIAIGDGGQTRIDHSEKASSFIMPGSSTATFKIGCRAYQRVICRKPLAAFATASLALRATQASRHRTSHQLAYLPPLPCTL